MKARYFFIALAMLLIFIASGFLIGELFNQGTIYVDRLAVYPSDTGGIIYNVLQYNGENLTDHTTINTTSYCEAYNLGMNISIYPCLTKNRDRNNMRHYVDFTWQGGQARDLSWVFVYEGDLDAGGMFLGVNTSHNETIKIPEERYIFDYRIENVTGFVNLGQPTAELCELGTENNTFMYQGTQSNQTGGDIVKNYCFSAFQNLGGGVYELDGNATVNVNTAVEVWEYEFKTPVNVDYLGRNLLGNNFSFYRVVNVTFQPGQTYRTQWVYTPNGDRGKFHIFGYEADKTIQEAIDLDQYIYVDPAWDLQEESTWFKWDGNGSDWGYNGRASTTSGISYNSTVKKLGTHSLQDTSGGYFQMTTGYSDNDGESWSWCSWVYHTVVNGDAIMMAQASSNAGGGFYQLVWTSSPADEKWTWKDYGGADPSSTATHSPISLNTWYYYCQSYDVVSNTNRRWLDGVLIENKTQNPEGGTTNFWRFGQRDTGTNDFDGLFDDFRYYDNYTFTQSDIDFLYNGGAGTTLSLSQKDLAPRVNLLAPTNATIINNTYTVYFAAQLLDDLRVLNSTLYVWYDNGTLYNTYFNTESSNDTTRNQSVTFTVADNNDGFKWNYFIFDNSTTNAGVWNDTNWTINLSVLSTPLTITTTLLAPATNYQAREGLNLSLAAQGVVIYGNFTNSTIYVWNNETHALVWSELNNTLNNLNGTIIINQSHNFTHGGYNWNVRICARNSSLVGLCDEGNSNFTFGIDGLPPYFNFTQIVDQFSPSATTNVTLNFTGTDRGSAGVDTCWFSNETGGNETAVCGVAQTLTYTTTGVKTIYMFINDSLGNYNQTSQSFDIGTYIQAVDKATIGEGDTATFNLTLTKTGIGSLTVNPDFNYNNTVYATVDTTTTTANQVIIIKSITIPGDAGSVNGTNVTWYWNFSVSTVGNYTTQAQTQTVYSLGIDDCSTYSTVLLNYTLYDEDDRTILDGALTNASLEVEVILSNDLVTYTSNFSVAYNRTNPNLLCISDGFLTNSSYRMDAQAKYQTDDRALEYHNIQYYVLNSTQIPINVSLYDLDVNKAVQFLINVKDTFFLPLQDALVDINRKYLPIGEFISVEVPKTDQEGNTIGNFIVNDEIYNIFVYKNGELLGAFTELRVFCVDPNNDCRLSLNLGSSTYKPSDFSNKGNLSYISKYNESTRTYQFIYTSTNGVARTVNVTGLKFDNWGNNTICSQERTGISDIVSCVFPQVYENSTAIVKVSVDGSPFVESIFPLKTKRVTGFDGIGYILAFFLILTLSLMLYGNPVFMLVGFLLGFIAASTLALLGLGGLIGAFSAFLWLVISTIILIWKASKSREGSGI